MKLQKINLIGILIVLLLIRAFVGRFFPPVGLLASLFVISILTAIIIFTQNDFNIITKSVLTYLFIGLNDVGIKLFSGGVHDSEGLGWVHLLLFIGLVPSFIMLLVGAVGDKTSTNWTKVLSVLLFMLLIFIHLELFSILGLQES